MKVEVTALVNYTCFLSTEDEKRVRDYASKNDCSFEEAVMELYSTDMNFNLYKHSTESDFTTKSIDYVDEED